jgi:hypothetical protein
VKKREPSQLKQMIFGALLLGTVVLVVSMAVLFFWRWFLS